MLVGFLVVAPLSSIFTPWSTPNGWSDQRGSPSKHRSDLIRASIDRINKVPTIITLNPLWKTASTQMWNLRTVRGQIRMSWSSKIWVSYQQNWKAHVSCMFSCDFTSFYIEDLKKHTKIHYSSENPPRSDLRGGDINRINRKGPGSHQDPISNTQ